MIMHDDGSGEALYAGGMFSSVNGGDGCKIAKWNGEEWSSLPPAFNGGFGTNVRTLAEYGGDLIVAGQFSQPSSIANHIMRWTGTEWLPLGSGLNSGVEALTVFQGDLIVGGNFTTAGGQAAQRVARWNGSTWSAMPGLTGSVLALAVFNNELYAAGSFSLPSRIAKWNGTTWVGVGDGFNNTVRALKVFNGALIAGGSFTASGTAAVSRIAQWDGAVWQSLETGTNGTVAAFATLDGKLAVGGQFTLAGSTTVSHLALWNGSTWEAIAGSPVPDIANTPVWALLSVESNGRDPEALYVGGWFAMAGGQSVNNIARYSDGQWSALGDCPSCQGLSGVVRSMVVHDDGSGAGLFVAGISKCFGSLVANNIARWDGSSWSSLAGGMNHWVNELCEFGLTGGNVDLIAGGMFTLAGSTSANRIARWDGKAWHALDSGIGDGMVLAMAVFDDGSGPALYVGGTFTNAGGVAVSGLARWNGTSWSDVGGGVAGVAAGTGAVIDLLVWDDGSGPSLVVGGKFSSVGAGAGQVMTRGIARWRNGAWSAIGPSYWGSPGVSSSSSFVKSLAIWPSASGASLVCGGDFDTMGGVFTGPVARWNGVAWQPVSPSVSDPFYAKANAILAYTNGTCNQLFVNAWFPLFMLGNWNGATWDDMGGGLTDDAGVIWGLTVAGGAFLDFAAFAMFQDRLVVAGDFTTVGGFVTNGGQPASNIAIWDVEASLSCLGDIDGDDAVNINDLLAVINHWGACTDCAEDPSPCGGDGQVNINDLLEVINQWGPCP